MKLRNKKTGEIIETHLLVVQSVEDPTKRYYTSSIKDLCDNYEDYKPAEPLIKDEKVRKAVRAWAEVMGVKTVEYDDYWQSFRRDNSTICFRDNGDYYFEKLENGKEYTITELCGEEKE